MTAPAYRLQKDKDALDAESKQKRPNLGFAGEKDLFKKADDQEKKAEKQRVEEEIKELKVTVEKKDQST